MGQWTINLIQYKQTFIMFTKVPNFIGVYFLTAKKLFIENIKIYWIARLRSEEINDKLYFHIIEENTKFG